jgi:predicted small lipoprotein YifL
MKFIALIALAALAACGVDGPPERPVEPKPQPGVSVSGDAQIGMRATL